MNGVVEGGRAIRFKDNVTIFRTPDEDIIYSYSLPSRREATMEDRRETGTILHPIINGRLFQCYWTKAELEEMMMQGIRQGYSHPGN